jgi:hypothetical protein
MFPARGDSGRSIATTSRGSIGIGRRSKQAFDARALRLPEKLYRARKRVEQIGAGKEPLPAGESVESMSRDVDRARNALLISDMTTAETAR